MLSMPALGFALPFLGLCTSTVQKAGWHFGAACADCMPHQLACPQATAWGRRQGMHLGPCCHDIMPQQQQQQHLQAAQTPKIPLLLCCHLSQAAATAGNPNILVCASGATCLATATW